MTLTLCGANVYRVCLALSRAQIGQRVTKHFLWEFKNSDAYGAASLDKLHVFDGGVWGRHLWKVIVAVLQKMNRASEFNENFDNLPRWRDLAHLSAPTTIDYSESETFLTILKCALPCLVQLMPNKSCLVRVVRIMQKINIMLGLEVATKTDWTYWTEINDEFGKDFRFLKQHMLSHASADIRAKGATRNTTTRVGEGFQQEVSAMYKKTNGKRAEHQISVIDEKEETLAYLDVKVDAWQRMKDDEDELLAAAPMTMVHWRLGTASRPRSSHSVEQLEGGNSEFRNFDMRLREYIARQHPGIYLRREDDIEIVQCKTLYVDFQSRVNWKQGRDILRCNPMFHERPRYDSVMYAAEGDESAMARLDFLCRCRLPDGQTIDLALTRTDCPIREWQPARPGQCKTAFIAVEHITRGCLLAPIPGAAREIFYVMDCVDADMFLRLHNVE
ncbi:hypothetical protein FB45DRAFT_1043189 [Roridomyces roridus]|uniref:Uncharacterized protein n=1 Tax=Roridomyces roridus TaxID=1738132 RepID=A0AAD7AYT0_9AGAR|nr:hypothetical protein FB45DRAFT_1043189 [Roridomyces roridus]